MRYGYRFVGVCLLSAAIVMPEAIRSAGQTQDRDHNNGNERRAYDQSHRDWHDWDEHEEAAYKRYLQEKHSAYRSYFDVDVRMQADYWNWRHGHPEPGMQLRFYDQRAHDWHQWDDNEERAYRQYLNESHRPYVEFSVGGPQVQLDYWNWRHTHPNIDDRDVNRYHDDHDGDYHQWNADEDRAYRRWLEENHRPYISFSIGGANVQAEYWAWRHTHPDYRTFYDPVGRVQVVWDDNEDRRYRRYLEEHHQGYVDITVLGGPDQRAYWSWRHSHPDQR